MVPMYFRPFLKAKFEGASRAGDRQSRVFQEGDLQMDKNFQGDLIASAGMVYDYTSVGGYIYARGADTRTAFP